jgi:single-strand DNA-binding protein
VAIETATKEDTEMARTRKTDQTTENVIQLRPETEEPPQVDDQVDRPPEHTLEEAPETDEALEQLSRSRGPALNRVELIGRVTKEADVRVTPSGMHVAYLRVATNGLRDRDTEFHQLTAFGKTAEFVGEHLGKGRLVYVEGRLQTRDYRDRDGVRRWVTTVLVNRLQVLDHRRAEQQ